MMFSDETCYTYLLNPLLEMPECSTLIAKGFVATSSHIVVTSVLVR